MSTVDLSGLAWRKSSRSGQGNDNNCVEVAWRKSTRSGQGSGNACVEVAFAGPAVLVRDSKNPAAGVLAFPESGWNVTFLSF